MASHDSEDHQHDDMNQRPHQGVDTYRGDAGGGRHPCLLQEPDVQRHPANVGGETRLINDEASCARTVGHTGSQTGKLPINATALAR